MTEKAEARRDGGKLQKNSGRGINKGDYVWHNFVVDLKEHRETFGLSRRVWAKICGDAFSVDSRKSPVLKVVLGEGNQKTRLAVIEWSLLEELINE